MPKPDVVLSVRITRGEKVRFRAACRRNNVTMSELLRARIRMEIRRDASKRGKPARLSDQSDG